MPPIKTKMNQQKSKGKSQNQDEKQQQNERATRAGPQLHFFATSSCQREKWLAQIKDRRSGRALMQVTQNKCRNSLFLMKEVAELLVMLLNKDVMETDVLLVRHRLLSGHEVRVNGQTFSLDVLASCVDIADVVDLE